MESSELDIQLKKESTLHKVYQSLYIFFIATFFASIVGMIITYIVSKNKADAVNAVQKLSTTEQKELLNSYLETPMRLLIIILIVSIIGYVVFRILKYIQLRKKYEIEYEMKDSIPKMEK